MKRISTTKTIVSAAAVVACVVPFNIASAAEVAFPDLSLGGDFTLDAGDVTYTTNGVNVNIADQATSVVTINGDWIGNGATEIQLAGVNYHAIQDVTLNIGPAGSVTWGKGWIGDGPGGGGTVLIDIAGGGSLSYLGGQFLRWHPAGWFNADQTSWENAFNEGILKRDGLSVGTFADNFDWSDDGGGGYTITALVPEPTTFALAGLGLAGLLIARRRS